MDDIERLKRLITDADEFDTFLEWLQATKKCERRNPLILNSCGKFNEGAQGVATIVKRLLPDTFYAPRIHVIGPISTVYRKTWKWSGIGSEHARCAIVFEFSTTTKQLKKLIPGINVLVVNLHPTSRLHGFECIHVHGEP